MDAWGFPYSELLLLMCVVAMEHHVHGLILNGVFTFCAFLLVNRCTNEVATTIVVMRCVVLW
jgi:hypothetical protein